MGAQIARSDPILELVPTEFLAATATAVYTSPFTANTDGYVPPANCVDPHGENTNGLTAITGFVFCNTDTADRTITVHIVPSGRTASAENKIIAEASIPANTTWFKHNEDYIFVVPCGANFTAFSDVADKVNITLYGKEIS